MITINKITTEGEPRVSGGTFLLYKQHKETPLPKMGFRCATSGDPRIPWSMFYGYNSVDDGPGPDAFQKCLALSRQSKAPILVLFGQNSCPTCKSFVEYVNAYDNGIGTILGHSEAVNCYFCMNSADTLPAAGVDAMQTVQRFLGETPVMHHVMYVCGEFADGTTYCKPIQVVNDWQSLFSQIKSLVQEYKMLYEQHAGTSQHGDGDINNAIQNASSGFIPGQWYLYSEDDGNLQSFIDYATQTKLPVIAVGSGVGCNSCRAFKTNVLKNKTMMQWLANSNYLLLHCFSATGDWISPVLKLFLRTFVKETGTVLPFICVWKNGKTCFKTTHSTQAYTYYIQEFSKYINEHGDGNIDNEILLDAANNFIVGQWYKLNGTEADVQKFFDFAVEAKLPVIVERSASGCVNCTTFHNQVLIQPDVVSWFATSGCLLYHEFSGSGWFTGKPQRLSQKLLYSKRYGEGWQPGIPMTGVWYNGQLVADLFASFNKQKVIEYYEECLAKVDGWNDDKKGDDIKLQSFGTSTTTSKDAGSESVGLGSDVVFAQNRQEYSDILTNLQKSASCFYGWNSHYNTGSNLQEIVNTPNGRGDALDLAVDSMDKNCRPLFLIYTKAYNKGSNAFNKTFYDWTRAFPTALGNMSKCQTTAFDSSKTEYGFYFLHYQNNADETDANANKAKAFITQFGQITTGYPWYIAYCKYPDGHVYARYGSLYSLNKSISQIQDTDITNIYTKWGDAVKEFGKEIAYTYTEDDPPDDPPTDGEYNWGSEKAQIILGKPYLFTEAHYNYCIRREAPVAVIYYDTKTSAASKKLYSSVLSSKDGVKALERKMSSYKIQNPDSDKYKGGYCCFMVYDRCGNIQGPDPTATGLLKSGSFRFPVLALSYNGKTYCHTLPDAASADELAEAIYGKCESGEGGIGKFSAWSGRAEWLEHQLRKPDSEIKPDKAGSGNLDTSITSIDLPAYWEDPPALSAYANYDSGYNGDFAGIQKISARPDVTWVLNLADVSTPETTYLLVGSYDMNNPDQCPWTISLVFPKYITNCDQYKLLKNGECLNGGFTNAFKTGLKYRFFIFFEFSHGGHQSISIDGKFSYTFMWNSFKTLSPAQRVWGMFDSCHSGSMIKHKDITPHPEGSQLRAGARGGDESVEQDEPVSIIPYLEQKFERRAALMQAVTGGQVTAAAATAAYNPRMVLWSSTGSRSYGWYAPGRTTDFMTALRTTFASSKYWTSNASGKTYLYDRARYGWAGARDDTGDYDIKNAGKTGEQAFPRVQKIGASKHSDDLIDLAIPQSRNYPQKGSPETTIIFY